MSEHEGIPAVVCVDGWAGRREHPCRVVGETHSSYRITVDAETKLPGRMLAPGDQALVPRRAIRFTPTTGEPTP